MELSMCNLKMWFKISFLMILGMSMVDTNYASDKASETCRIMVASTLDLEDVQDFSIVEGNKSPTLNGMGYVFLTISPLGETFLEHDCQPGKRVLEIGSGYNNIPLRALKNGVDAYIANDLSIDHLKILVKKVVEFIPDKLDNLFILEGKAPQDLPFIDSQYDAIFLDKVIHFMPPDEIIQLIGWSKLALKDNGRIYVLVASPYSKLYAGLLPHYLQRKIENKAFPGHFENIMGMVNQKVAQTNYQNYQVPQEMVLFSRLDLVDLFQSHDMTVTSSYSFNIPTGSNNKWVDCLDSESNVVGIIANKTNVI